MYIVVSCFTIMEKYNTSGVSSFHHLTTTRRALLTRADSGISMCAIVTTVLPHVVGRAVLTTIVLRHAMTRILSVHMVLDRCGAHSARLILAAGEIADRLIVIQGSSLTVLDLAVDCHGSGSVLWCVSCVWGRHCCVMLGCVRWRSWYTLKSILQMITHYFNFGTVLYTMYASYAMKMGTPHILM